MKQKRALWLMPLLLFMLAALVCASSAVAASNTSTVDAKFIVDKTTVAAGDLVNLSILGLDASGAVDLFGEQQGSTIMAVVSSQLGNVVGGNATGALPGAGGAFASSVSYVSLTQGNGSAFVRYPATVAGDDVIRITLQEVFPNEQGGLTYNTISASDPIHITVTPASGAVSALDITSFALSAADAAMPGTAADGLLAGGIDGAMTAGVGGDQVTVVAVPASTTGTVTLTIYNELKSYTFTGMMNNGVAIITLDDTITKAGQYFMKAEIAGFAGNSIDFIDDDTLKVNALGTVKKLALVSEKAVISDDATAAAGTKISVKCLDKFGNTTVCPVADGIDVHDSEGVFSDFSFTAGGPYFKTIGAAGGEVLKLGTSSMVASMPTQSTVEDSDPLAVKVVDKNLVAILNAGGFAGGAQVAGTTFNGFDVAMDAGDGANDGATGGLNGTYDNPAAGNDDDDDYVSTTATTTMVIDHIVDPTGAGAGATKVIESLEVDLPLNTVVLESLFKVATPASATVDYFLIKDKKGRLGECIVAGPAVPSITTASPAAASVVNGHGEVVTAVPVAPAGTNYVATIPEANVKMKDSYGNAVAGTAVAAGTFKVESANGAVATAGLGASLIPSDGTGDAGTTATVTYDPAVFSGADVVTMSFTKPGPANLELATTVPVKPALASIVPSISQTAIPINGIVAMCVDTLDQNSRRFDDPAGVTITIEGSVDPNVVGLNGGIYVSGQQVDFTTTPGREVIVLTVPDHTGDFKLTFKNATGSVTAEKSFTVTKDALVTPPADGFPSAAMTPVDFPATADPTATPVTVAEGSVALTPTMTATCADVVSAIGYVWIPSANFGTAIPATVTCAGGVATFNLGTVDFTGYTGVYDIYFGYIDGSGDIHYNAYELTIN